MLSPALLLTLLTLVASALPAPDEGDSCRLSHQKQGVCRRLEDCPKARMLLWKRGVKPTLCSFKGHTAFVCCEEKTQPLKEFRRTAKEKCLEYSRWWQKSGKSPGSCTIGPPKETTFSIAVFGGVPARRNESTDSTVPMATDTSRAVKTKPPVYAIFGGLGVKLNEFPHMAHLGYGRDAKSLTWECGGSLISEQYILTAGHCRRNRDGKEISNARLGGDASDTTLIVPVNSIISHPKYNPRESYNDIALLRLSHTVQFSVAIRPACLQVEKEFAGKRTISGWGRTESSGYSNSEKLLKADLPPVDHAECVKTYGSRSTKLPQGLREESMVCAGELESGVDACNGDSGGPLQIIPPTPDCMYSIVGVTSFGISCGLAPGVYSRVSHFVPWIESIVWPARPIWN